MKIAITMALSNSHAIYLDHFIKSILFHNPDFDKDWFIFHKSGKTDTKFDLSQHNMDHLSTLYPFKFVEVDNQEYEKYGKGWPIFYSIELFKLRGYDYIIYWGADMLCMQPLDGLFDNCQNINSIGMTKEIRRPTCNNGGMVVSRQLLNDKTYRDLLEFDWRNPAHDDVFGHDQKILNIYFSGKIEPIDQKYNVLVSEANCLPRQEIVILHYIYKPTQAADRLEQWQLEEWHKYDNPKGLSHDLIY